MRRACSRCAGRSLSHRSMRAPVVEIIDIFGQGLLQMTLIEDEHVVQALSSDGSHPALGYGVGSRRSEWRANLGNTKIANTTVECGTITAVAVMDEKPWRLAIPSTAFDHLLSRPRGGGVRRHVHMENLPAGMIDHEEHVQRSECDRSDAEEVARPDLRRVLPQERPPSGGRGVDDGFVAYTWRLFWPKPRIRASPAQPGSSADPIVGSPWPCGG
jgi:hypothetical protein